MSIEEILLTIGGGGGLVMLLFGLIKVKPVEFKNPIPDLLQKVGRAINAEVLEEVKEVRKELNKHIVIDDQREADRHRERILKFNNELVRGIGHTKEDYVDVLATIDAYEHYCETHPDYKNSRAVHAIANIEKRYDDRLEKNDFL